MDMPVPDSSSAASNSHGDNCNTALNCNNVTPTLWMFGIISVHIVIYALIVLDQLLCMFMQATWTHALYYNWPSWPLLVLKTGGETRNICFTLAMNVVLNCGNDSFDKLLVLMTTVLGNDSICLPLSMLKIPVYWSNRMTIICIP